MTPGEKGREQAGFLPFLSALIGASMASVVRLKWNEAEYRHLMSSPSGAVTRKIMAAGEMMAAEARALAEVDTGAYARSIRTRLATVESKTAIDIVATAVNRNTGFPYPVMLNRKGSVRVPRPHRALLVALRKLSAFTRAV